MKAKNTPVIFLTGTFLLGNSIINLPFSKYPSNTFLGFIIALLISLPLFIFFDRYNQSVLHQKNGILNKIFLSLFAVTCLFYGLISMRNFITFSDKTILPEINSFFPIILYLLLLFLFCIFDKRVIIKTAFICGLVILFIMLTMFIFSFKNFRLNGLLKFNNISIKGLLYESLSYICLSFIPSIALIIFVPKSKNEHRGIFIKGFLFGALLLAVSFLQSTLIFGYNLLSRLNHPYASSISIITIGNNYSRLEGFSYLIYFAASLIKTTVCVYSSKEVLETIYPKAKKIFLPLILILFGAVSYFVDPFKNIEFSKIAPYILLRFIMVLPLFFRKEKTVKV